MKINKDKLKQVRKSVDRNLTQFCERVGIPEDTWLWYESGRRNPPIGKVLTALNGYKIGGFEMRRLSQFEEEDIT